MVGLVCHVEVLSVLSRATRTEAALVRLDFGLWLPSLEKIRGELC